MLSQKSFVNKNILMLGYGKSGQSVEKLLNQYANNIFIYDKKINVKILKNIKNKLKINKNNIFFENNLKNILNNNKIHFCIISPGISIFSQEYKLVKQYKIKILSELDVGYLFSKGKIFAITGTNGKTTTVNILHHIFQTVNKDTYLCGNVGIPLCDIANKTSNKSLIVCEVSSFQLESSSIFTPFISAILNIRPDHIDRHKSFNNYIIEKNKINKNSKTIKYFNYDDKITNNLSKHFFNAKYFSVYNKKIYSNKINLINKNNLLGEYNLSNLMCAVCLAKEIGIKNNKIQKAITTFMPLPHRLNIIGKKNHIVFINDSKSTNIASTENALQCFNNKNVILLLGGSNKNLDFAPLAKIPTYHTIAYGEIKDEIAKQFNNRTNFSTANNLLTAFNKATELAEQFNKNDNNELYEKNESMKNKIYILLSPASASFDEFTGYEARGEYFTNLVKAYLAKDNKSDII